VGRSLSTDPNIRGLLQGEQPEIWVQSDLPPVDLSVGDIRSQIAAEWLGYIQTAQRSQWRAYRKPPSLFRMVPSPTSYDFPSPPKKIGTCESFFFSFESNLESNRPSDSFSNRIFESNRPYTTQAVFLFYLTTISQFFTQIRNCADNSCLHFTLTAIHPSIGILYL